MGGAVGKIVGAVINPVWAVTGGLLFKALGIETQEKTITDLQVSDLLTPGSADKTARRTLKHQSMGDALIFQQGYSTFKRDYRKKYSTQFLQSVGYLPVSTATTYRPTKSKSALYIKGLYGYQYVHIDTVKDSFLTSSEKINHAKQLLQGYDISKGKVFNNSKEYLIYSTTLVTDTSIDFILREDFRRTIKEYLSQYYISNGLYLYNGNAYEIREVTDTVVASNYTVRLYPLNTTLSTIDINVPVAQYTETITNVTYGNEATFIKYKVLSGEVPPYFLYIISEANTLDIYDTEVLDVTAIVPLKEDGIVTDFSANNLKRMLNKLNIVSDDLESAIKDNPDMDSAYLFTGINTQHNDDITNKAIYDFFSYFAKSNGNYSISLSKLQMRYSFNISRTINTGSIGVVGTILRSETGAGLSRVMTLSYQVDSDNYITVVVSNFVLYYVVSGYEVTAYLDSGNGYCRLLIPLEMLNKMRYKEFVWVYERSLALLAFSVDVVKIKWYETAGFGTLLKIAALVVLVVSLGTASNLSAALWGIATTAAIGLGATLLAKAIGGPLGAIVGAVAFVVGMVYAPGIPNMGSADIWLLTASQAISTFNTITQMKFDELKANYQAFIEEMTQKTEELQELNKEYEDKGVDWFNMFDPTYAGRPLDIYTSTAGYCENAVRTDVSYIVDYNAQIATQISYRNSVVSGM